MLSRSIIALAGFSLALTFAPCSFTVGSASSSDVRTNPAAADWPAVGGDWANTRYSTLKQINRSNIGRLQGAWFKELTAQTRTPPVVFGGVMYICDTETIYALDPKTGRSIWEYKPGVAPARGGVSFGEGLIFSGLRDARIIALDAKTGKLVWTTYIGTPRDSVTPRSNMTATELAWSGQTPADAKTGWITNAVNYANGVVTSGLSGGDAGVTGAIAGLDANTGRILWKFSVVPSPGSPGAETWPADGEAQLQGGGAVWTHGATDPELGLVYYDTGNAVPQLGGELRLGDNLYIASVVALDIKTGKLRWHFQLTHHDIWEMDAPTPIILYTARVQGKPRKALAAMRTDGYLFLLDRENGQPLLPIEERAVEQDIRQRTSATQPFPVGANRVGPDCAEPDVSPVGFILGCWYDPLYYDKPNVIAPVDIMRDAPMSYSAQTHYIYATGVVSPFWLRRFENPTIMIARHPPGTKEYGILAAIDSRTNRIVWQKRSRWGLASGSGALSTAGGLVFHVEGDGNLQADDAKTGATLWQFQMGMLGFPGATTMGGGSVPLATYETDGEQYLAAPIGKGLWSLKIGGNIAPRPAPPTPPTEHGFEGAVLALPNDGTAEVQLGAMYQRAEHYFDEYAYVPLRARLKAGSSLRWTNYGVKTHTIVSADGSWTTGEIPPGGSVSVVVPKKGTYVYYSKEFPWAKGQLFVQ